MNRNLAKNVVFSKLSWLKDAFLSAAKAAPVLHPNSPELRQLAFQRLESTVLTDHPDSDWRYLEALQLLSLEYRLAADLPFSSALRLPDFTNSGKLVLENGRYQPSLATVPKGVLAAAISQGALSQGSSASEILEVSQSHLNSFLLSSATELELLNLSLLTDGFTLKIPSGLGFTDPLIITNGIDSANNNGVAATRNCIELGDGSSAVILETVSGAPSSGQTLLTTASSYVLKPNSTLHLIRVVMPGQTGTLLDTVSVQQAENSSISTVVLYLDGKNILSQYHVALSGTGASSQFSALSSLSGSSNFCLQTKVAHQAPQATSEQRYKALLRDSARSSFTGTIAVDQAGQKTSAYQASRALLLSPNAVSNVQPQLKIFADDVKCTHGATAGPLNAEQLFYLQSRGLSKTAATTILTEAFANEVLSLIKVDALRSWLSSLLNGSH